MTTMLLEPAPEPVLAPVPADVPRSSEIAEAELTIDELGERIVGMAGRLAAATCRWLLLVAAFDARDGCARSGLASTARWLTHCCGLSTRAASDHVRVARVLAAYPTLARKMSAGRLSYSHARAISRLAPVGETTERDERTVVELIEIAECGTVGQLETVVRGLRTVDDAEALDGGVDTEPPEQYLRTGWTSTSQWQLAARLDPERGALIDKAIDTVAAAEGITRVDALERVAEIALTVMADAGQARDLRGDERAAVIVHLDATTAAELSADMSSSDARSSAATSSAATSSAATSSTATSTGATSTGSPHRSGLSARLADGPGLPRRVVRRLLCEGRVRTSVHRSDGSLFDLGRTRRVVTRRLFRALLHRDGCCTHPGCGSRQGLEAHHVWHWIDGGPTDLANLVLLCKRHHHTHHEGAFSIDVKYDGSFVFRRPDGSVLERQVDPSKFMASVPDLPAGIATVPRWTGTGERLDRHWAIAILAQRRHRNVHDVAAA